MNLSKLNEWLSLIASLGVVVGLIFLVAELNQSNRIAGYGAENARRNQFLEIANSRIENAEVLAKLKEPQPSLTPTEEVKALYLARQHTNTWADAEAAYNYGLLTDATFNEIYKDIDAALLEAPGLGPHFEYILSAYDVEALGSPVFDYLAEAIE